MPRAKSQKRKNSKTQITEVEEMVVVEERLVIKRHRWPLIVMGGLVLLVLFWWRTNTWPVTAVVNGMPIWRFEVDRTLYRQYGSEVVDGLITDKLVRQELAKKDIKVGDDQIEERLNEIKGSLGESYKEALAAQGMSESELKNQIRFELKLEKMFEDKATESGRLQLAILEWIDGLKAGAKIWMIK